MAATDRLCVIVTVQESVPVQAPLQPVNEEPGWVVAVRVTIVPKV